MQEAEYTLAILNTPLGDEFGIEFAQDILEEHATGVVLIVKNELIEHVERQLEETTAFVVPKPINKTLLQQNIKFILNSRQKMQCLMQCLIEKNEKLEQKMDDLKLVYRAKLCLMGYLDMTEEQAHRDIQKHAMDMCLKPAEVAVNLIKTYEHR
ncbi:ANTAR domain-containing response regulator [Eubacterium aggregans]|uniref:ANTAR domain-containing response regulator n=1 Tax=Eubacterium aggregans TaxID=81409 RepID=UPI003F311524